MKNLYIFLLIIIFTGCKITSDEESNKLIIKTSNSKLIDISQYIDSVEFIPLQTTDSSLIRFCSKVLFLEDRILILDKIENAAFLFDKKGNYLTEVGRQGGGPGEFLRIFEGMYEPAQKRIIIYDDNACKLLFYDLQGTFIKEVANFNDLNLIRNIINLPNGNFLCYTHDITPDKVGEKASGLWEVDSLGTFLRSYFTVKEVYPVIYNSAASNFQYSPDNNISIRDLMNEKIYHFKENELMEYVSFDIPNNERNNWKGETYCPENYTIMMSYHEKGNYLFSVWTDKVNEFTSIYSKENGSFKLVYPSEKLWSDATVAQPTDSRFLDTNRTDILLTYLSGSSILENMANENLPDPIKKQLISATEGMNEEEIQEINPVLQLLYIK